jgi:DNA-binding transcriptional LysR family regulator
MSNLASIRGVAGGKSAQAVAPVIKKIGSRLRRDKRDNMHQSMPKNAIFAGGRLIEVEAAAALARVRNFRAAAAEVGLSPTAFSRTIALLEDRLGVQLFARTTRSVAPTQAGERFLARAQPALRELHVAMTDAQDGRDRPQGTLRLTCAVGAARRILEPVLLALLERYPDLRIDLVTDARLADIVAEEFDAGFRIGDAVPRDMVKIPVSAPLRHAVVASPAVVRAHGAPRNPNDLLSRPCIRFRRADGTIDGWEFKRAADRRTLDVAGTLTLDDPTLAHQAALAGAGYAYLARWNVENDVATGRLQSVLEAWLPEQPGLCLYYPRARHPSAALRALIALVESNKSGFSPR